MSDLPQLTDDAIIELAREGGIAFFRAYAVDGALCWASFRRRKNSASATYWNK